MLKRVGEGTTTLLTQGATSPTWSTSGPRSYQPAHPPNGIGVSSPIVSQPLDVFVSYAPADEGLWKELEKHLRMLERRGEIRAWGAHSTDAGEDWLNVVHARLGSARVILLLLSADFFASDHCYDVEVEKALALADEGKARLIPIRVRPYDWGALPFKRLRTLPANGQPVMSWPNPDDAWAEIAREIRLAIVSPLPDPRMDQSADSSREILFRKWSRAEASGCVLEQLRSSEGLREPGLGPLSIEFCDISHEIHDFLYVKYIDYAAYIAVVVTRPDPPDNCHASAPKLSFVEFVETSHGWRLGTVHVNAVQAGAWGNPPSKMHAMDIGYNMFAIVIEGGFTNQGYTMCYTSIHAAVAGEFKKVFMIETYGDDSGTGRPREDSWSTEIEIERKGTSFYGLVVHRSGLRCGKALDEKQVYRFDGREYAQSDLYR